MKYIKMFEEFSQSPKFFRFSQEDLLGGNKQAEITPKEKPLWGSEEFNQALLNLGFPDKRRCIDFMDELAFDPSYKALYGKNIYQIMIDEDTRLGWSFILKVNEWYYKGIEYDRELGNEHIQNLRKDSTYDDFYWCSSSPEDVDKIAGLVLDKGLIGTGTLKDLMSSPYWGKEKAFIWTPDKFLAIRYEEPAKAPREARPYASKPALTKDDFVSRGIAPERIPEFWKSEFGAKVSKVKSEAEFDRIRKEALALLDSWVQVINS